MKGGLVVAGEVNKTLAQRHFDDVLNAGDLAAVDEIYADDVVFRGPSGVLCGRERVREWITDVHLAFQEFSVNVDFMIAEGDRVLVRSMARGYHRQAFMDMKASDRRLVLPMVFVFGMAREKITELEVFYDSKVFVEELGSSVPLARKW